MTPKPQADLSLQEYLDAEADAYLASLPLEHFMEATAQARQREITLESFALVRVSRPDVQCFNELLIQYPREKLKKPGKVVPDNFVVVHAKPLGALKSFNYHTQKARPLLVLEYVSKENRRKDYEDNFEKYEVELEIPYYLLFYPDNEEMTLFKMGKKGYRAVPPNANGRVAIPELELEAGLLDGWVRFWFRGELLPLPGDLLKQRDAAEKRAATAEAEVAKLREELAKATEKAK
jgi:Uma2 family endonuclease